jgi:hypothetical protein
MSSHNEPMNEPIGSSHDLKVDNASFWLDTDLKDLLAGLKPHEGAATFAIDDLTSNECDRFGAALDE